MTLTFLFLRWGLWWPTLVLKPRSSVRLPVLGLQAHTAICVRPLWTIFNLSLQTWNLFSPHLKLTQSIKPINNTPSLLKLLNNYYFYSLKTTGIVIINTHFTLLPCQPSSTIFNTGFTVVAGLLASRAGGS